MREAKVSSKVARLARMDLTELAWRSRAAAWGAADRVRVAAATPAWNRQALLRMLRTDPELLCVRQALDAGAWHQAHVELSRHFVRAEPRFLVGAGMRHAIESRLRRTFTGVAGEAAGSADRILEGSYDLLGYRQLRFGAEPMPDWSYDPVHDRRPPRRCWIDVKFLEPACGDHKIIWELNRHQQWMTLGRAYWLARTPAYRRRFVEELASWLAANPWLVGINWASMLELALRCVSWLWSLHFFADDADEDATPWTVDLLIALDRQLGQIERHLSTYFSPNTHLLGEALALYVTGRALPELAASGRRQSIGRTLLLREARRQIADDGGHVERSTHYHHYTLDFYLLAAAIAHVTHDPIAGEFDRTVRVLARAARLLADDSGRIPHIGDDDGGSLLRFTGREPGDLRGSLGIAAALLGDRDLAVGVIPEEAYWLLAHPVFERRLSAARSVPARPFPVASGALPDTGYYVSRRANGMHVVIDGGKHGYQNGGHAHADALSLTCHVGGVPLLIDPGTGCYTIDPVVRDRFRSTPFHNTLTIDGRSQSVPGGPFHWKRTADSRVHGWQADGAFDFFDGSHDGYGPLEHRRRVLALHGDLLIVADRISGAARAAAHWHIDPRWSVRIEGGHITMSGPGACVGLAVPRGSIDRFTGDESSGLGWYSPAYGRIEPSTTIRIVHEDTKPFWLFSVFDFDPGNRVTQVELVPVRDEAGDVVYGAALRLSRTRSLDYFLAAEPPGGVAPSMLRAADLQTDAHMLFTRERPGRPPAVLALVDGSLVRRLHPSGTFELQWPREAPDDRAAGGADALADRHGSGGRRGTTVCVE